MNKKTVAKEDTKVDRWIKWFKNHRVFAPIIFGAIAITAIVGFAVLVNKNVREWIFTSSFTSESVKVVEDSFNRAIKNHPDQIARLEILKKFYVDISRKELQAREYFASEVKRYYTVVNLQPCLIDSYYVENTMDFQDPRSIIDSESFVFSEDSEGNPIITFRHKFSCFRAKRSKYESCIVLTKIIFDRFNRIIYLNDEKIEELVYTEERLE